MAFTLSDPVSGLFWSSDEGQITLSNVNPAVYVQEGDHLKNAESNAYVKVVDFKLVEAEMDEVNEQDFRLQFEENGGINWFPGRVFSICEGLEILPAQVNAGIDWVRTYINPEDTPEVDIVIQKIVEEVFEPEPEPEPVEEPVPELESDEDVPVARSAALIEEALNAKAQCCGCECGCGPDCEGCECDCGCPKVEKNDA
jgi:hypothetical protein